MTDVLAKMDARTAALYLDQVAPRLPADEDVVFLSLWTPTKFVALFFWSFVVFGSFILFLFFAYFRYETVLDACGEGLQLTCRRHYAGTPLLLVFFSGLAGFSLVLLLGAVSGRIKHLYVLTTKNLILVRVGLATRYETFALPSIRFRRESTVLHLSDGSRRRVLFLDTPDPASIEAYLQLVANRITR